MIPSKRAMLLLPVFVSLTGVSWSACNSEPSSGTDPTAEERIPTVHVEEIWRSSDHLLLSGVTDLAVDSRGRVYLADMDVGVILLSSSGGSWRSIGRKGGGPGEYEFISSLQVIDGDSLLIFDPSTRRVSVFEPDSGAFAYAHTLHRLPERQRIREIARVRGEARYVAVFPSPPEEPGGPPGGSSFVRLIDKEGRIVRDSLVVVPPGEDLVVTEELGGRVRASFQLSNPFGWQPTIRLKTDRIYYGRSDSLAIHIYDLEGNRIGGFSKSVSPRAITDQDVEREIEQIRDRASSSQLPDGVHDQWIEQLEANVPERWPAYRTFQVDDQGRIWVLPVGFPEDEEGPPAWRIYSPSGELLGRVAGTFPQAFANSRVYSATYDSLGVPTVAAYRIPAFPAGAASEP
ncbi:MAG: hypothetical protein ACREK5_08740 [Gemmatimonadota bacterium]